ncbi:MAG: hypothetical protein KC731_33555 [Myxococcales bacterium]|nr:hypothetical protein [Myxococcales bacterium]
MRKAAIRKSLRRFLWIVTAIAGGLAGTLGLFHAVQLGRVFGSRVAYPYDLEWMEGGQLYHAYRMLHDQPVFETCTDGFLPFPYPPMHAAVVALAGRLFGLSFLVARLVSVTAFALAAAILLGEVASQVRPRGRRLALVLVAAGGMAASYPITGAWYDLVRVDAVFFFLLVAGARLVLYFPRRHGGEAPARPPWSRLVFAAAVLAAALYAKQTAAFFFPWIALFAWYRYGRRGFGFGVLLGAFAALPGLWLVADSDGFFWTMMVGVMGRHPLVEVQARFAAARIALFAPPLLVMPLFVVWLARRRRLDATTQYWLGMLLSALVASIVTTAKVGAFHNNMMTACMLAWPVTTLVATRALDALPGHRHGRAIVATVFAGLAAFQLALLRYEPGRFVPSRTHWTSVAELDQIVSELDGGVLSPAHSFLPIANGHPNTQIHEQAYIDIMGAAAPGIDVIRCFGQLDARWLVFDSATQAHMQALIRLGYHPSRPLPPMASTPVGMYTRPVTIWERNEGAPIFAKRDNRRLLFDFEQGGYAGWTVEGPAFDWGPSPALNGFQSPVAGQAGRLFADSFHPRLGDAATGRLRSPSFVIDRRRLGFRAGGGRSARLHVDLVVDGQPVRRTRHLGQNFEMLGPQIWDVSDLQGKTASLEIVDEEPEGWGHLMVDEVELFDPAPESGVARAVD